VGVNDMAKDRFKFETRGLTKGAEVITDTKTGVQYLHAWFGTSGGVTVLVDREGKPLIDEKYR